MAGYTKISPGGGGEFALTKENFGKLNDAAYDLKRRDIDVRDYDPNVGTGSAAVDTAALQAAATDAIAANARLVLPPSLTLNSTINLVPTSGGQFHLDVTSSGPFSQITWTGGDNTSVFKSYGWKRSRIDGVHVRLGTGKTGVVVWDVDHDSTRSSTGLLTWNNCRVTTAGSSTSCVGWRLGHTSGAEFSFITWIGCSVEWDAVTGTPLGWVMEENNGLVLSWIGCSATGCARAWTTTSTSGAGSANGGGAMYWYGCGTSVCDLDYDLTASTYLISGGRYELGKRFLNVPGGTGVKNITVQGVLLDGYNPADGQIFRLDSRGVLILDNCEIKRNGAGADYTSSMVRLSVGGTYPAVLIVRGGAYQAADPFYLADGSVPIIEVRGVAKMDGNGIRSGTFIERTRLETVTALAYSATIATDASLSHLFTIVATNTTAYTISNPTNPAAGQTITFDIKNSSGGTMGVITWGGSFLLAGAFTNPANGKRRTISFYYDGTNWVETNRAAADI